MTSYRRIQLMWRSRSLWLGLLPALAVSMTLGCGENNRASGSTPDSSVLVDFCDGMREAASLGAIDEANTNTENAEVARGIARIYLATAPPPDLPALKTDITQVAEAFQGAADLLERGGGLEAARAILFSDEVISAARNLDGPASMCGSSGDKSGTLTG